MTPSKIALAFFAVLALSFLYLSIDIKIVTKSPPKPQLGSFSQIEVKNISFGEFHGANDRTLLDTSTQKVSRSIAERANCSVVEFSAGRRRLFRALVLLKSQLRRTRHASYIIKPCRRHLKTAGKKINIILLSLEQYNYTSSGKKLNEVKYAMKLCNRGLGIELGAKGDAEYKKSDEMYALASNLFNSSASCFIVFNSIITTLPGPMPSSLPLRPPLPSSSRSRSPSPSLSLS